MTVTKAGDNWYITRDISCHVFGTSGAIIFNGMVWHIIWYCKQWYMFLSTQRNYFHTYVRSLLYYLTSTILSQQERQKSREVGSDYMYKLFKPYIYCEASYNVTRTDCDAIQKGKPKPKQVKIGRINRCVPCVTSLPSTLKIFHSLCRNISAEFVGRCKMKIRTNTSFNDVVTMYQLIRTTLLLTFNNIANKHEHTSA